MAGKSTQLAKHLKEGSFVIIDDVPCRVDKVTISTSGKHGHAKVRVDAIGLIDGVRKSVIKTAHDSMEVPVILKRKGQVVSMIGADKAQIMDLETFDVIEMDVPEDRSKEILPGAEIEYFEVLDIKTLKRIK